jgi:short-subunit dehydrogenase
MASRPVTLITGASSGIGVALAREFARHGHELALVARRKARLEALADEVGQTSGKRPLVIVADLAKPDAPTKIAHALIDADAEPQYVVNNAGFGLFANAADGDRNRQLAMIDVNMRALTALSLMFVPSLERHKGGVLNVGSMAGFMPGPGMTVYYASKAFVRSFTDSLHREWRRRGLRVTNLAPGPVPTEFGRHAGVQADTAPQLLTQTAERVAAVGYRGLMKGRALVVPGALNRVVIALSRFVPRAVLLRVIERRQARRKAA